MTGYDDASCRRPRRLGGGKGGESRQARPPKNAPAGSMPAMPTLAALPPPPSADRDRERDRHAAASSHSIAA